MYRYTNFPFKKKKPIYCHKIQDLDFKFNGKVKNQAHFDLRVIVYPLFKFKVVVIKPHDFVLFIKRLNNGKTNTLF